MDEVEKHKYSCQTRGTALTLALMAQRETQVLLSNEGNGFDLGSNDPERNTNTLAKPEERL
jgi:hypothetical protein